MKFSAVSKSEIYGAYGEFTVGKGESKLRACFIETKIRPGLDGDWSNDLASSMVPWREIFDIEKVTFEELLQRDLNDSRVAHDLIPYLLGDTGNVARFFPPILAVMVPRNTQGTGIESYYPDVERDGEPDAEPNDEPVTISFGKLFDVVQFKNDDKELTPYARVSYNRQKSAFIIVDGQHRAMAVLALHRQLNQKWENSAYESYYAHIDVKPEDVSKIELPVTIIFFPELTERAEAMKARGITLDSACRELFLVVNRQAQPVSQARELLLDDHDFAAAMMRRTLSQFKGRREQADTLARIYSFKYGDSGDEGKAVLSGQIEISSAVALHKMHCIASFGRSDGFSLREPAEITDGRNHRNPDRPGHLLVGTELEKWGTLSRQSAKLHDPLEAAAAINLLGALNDVPLLALFDRFRPFCAHNAVLRSLRTRLNDPARKADPTQRKCLSLLFEGSGVRSVFEEHFDRLTELRDDAQAEGKPVGSYILSQLEDCTAVQKALEQHETTLKRERACALFNVAYDKFYANAAPDQHSVLEAKARAIYDTLSTQAFQIGYLMAVLTLVERGIGDGEYEARKRLVQEATDLVIIALNAYFAPTGGAKKHESLTGFVAESRSDLFVTGHPGLRGLLAMSTSELNEKLWVFFRYAIYEVLFCRQTRTAVATWLENLEPDRLAIWRPVLTDLAPEVKSLRRGYVEKAVNRALKDAAFRQRLERERMRLEVEHKPAEEVTAALEVLLTEERKRVEAIAREHVKASVKALNAVDHPIWASVPTVIAGEEEPADEDGGEEPNVTEMPGALEFSIDDQEDEEPLA